MDEMNTPQVAIYCRVAHQSEFGMENQRERLSRYAMSLGYSKLVYYEDNGASGLNFDRPGFRQMEADIQAGKIRIVLVSDTSKIGRNLWQTTAWIDSTIKNSIIILTPDGLYVSQIPNWGTLYKAYLQQQRTAQARKRK